LPLYPLNDKEKSGEPYFNETELENVRLAAKSFWDIPVEIDGEKIHVLMSHPRPPSYDDGGTATAYPDPDVTDLNGLQNHDEIRFWADYVDPEKNDYFYDDSEWIAAGEQTPSNPSGGFKGDERFIVVGDLNADPYDDDTAFGAIWQLLNNTMINTEITPSSEGAVELVTDGTEIEYKTVVFDSEYEIAENRGGVRADYSLISKVGVQPQHAQTVWPLTIDDLAYLNDASDHHMIFIDLDITSPSKPSIDINDGGNTIDVTIEAGVPEESNVSAATHVVGRAAIAALITMMSAALLL